ncbi:MAG TPA: MBL fold metallo-hydrolase [Candidatus Saccharimonadales bacterium]|nr:MBL fold metallo-hydrolase [Candidatus Saccharimonadales bacterium]
MKITKLVHSCLLVEMPEPVNRTVLFDPGQMSTVDVSTLQYLDDIVITHEHGDHIDVAVVKQLVQKFPEVRILTTGPVTEQLKGQGITATTEPPEGMELFTSPHENVQPLFPVPEQIGVHYLGKLSHPGDSLGFSEAKTVLALPVQAPWQKGTPVDAYIKAIELKPKYVLPIHDWHWRDEARESMYNNLEQAFAKEGITFLKLKNGEPVVLDI